MSDISLTASMRTNLLSLQNTQSLMDTTQERLSTGKKVNSAIDNPSSYYTAQNLTNRAGDLEGLLDSMGQGIQTIKAANEGIESITSFVEQAKAVANTARDTAYKTEVESSGTFTNSVQESADATANTETLTLKVGDVTLSYDVKGKSTGNAADGLTAVINGLTTGSNQTTYDAANFTIEANDAGNGIIIKAKDGASISGSVSIENGMGLTINGKLDTTSRQNSIDQYNDILAQIDQLAADASYKGINLLKGDELKVIFNEDRSSFIEIKSEKTADSTGLGLTAVTDWSDNDLVDDTITQVESAINTLRDMASEFGNNYSIVQTRQDFTENLINVLEEGADDLTLADMNEESANMLALQTRAVLIF